MDAVIDKDLAAAVLARELGAELFMILTDVDAVYAGWGTDQQRMISSMSVAEADRLGQEGAFGEGSMAPKVAAAADYVRRTQGRAIITELSKGRAAVHGIGGYRDHSLNHNIRQDKRVSHALGARVNIHEYQAKDIFRKYGIPIPPAK